MRKNSVALLAIATLLVVSLAPYFGAGLLPFNSPWGDAIEQKLFCDLRLPRILLALIVGGSLASLGALYQILFHNPLSEPYVLGVSSGTTLSLLGAQILFGLAPFSFASGLSGVAGGLIVTLALLSFSRATIGQNPERLLLFGIGLNFFLSSLLFVILSFQLQSSQTNFRFLFGQMPWISWRELGVLCVLLIPLLALHVAFARRLDGLGLGDSVARTLGVDPIRTRALFLLLSSLVLSILVSHTGSIGFVGLAVPHVARIAFRPQSSRSLLLLCFLLGGIFLIVSDVVSRAVLPPFEFPIGTVTTLLGGPIFIWMLWKR